MAPRIWYRGEGVNVAPATASGSRHDLKDGVYYTDTLDVAKQYASERAPRLDDQRVYQVSVEMDQMRVLDLTTHPEWKKLMGMQFPNGETPEIMLRRQPSAQEYEKWFDSFLRTSKTNLDNYDAVLGPEFRLGGTQMCVLAKGGQPSKFAEILKKLRVPVGGAPTSASPVGRLRYGGKIGPGLKGVAGKIGGGIAMIGLAILGSIIKKKYDAMVLEGEMKKVSGEIDMKIHDSVGQVAEILADKKKAYANITIDRVSYNELDLHTIPIGGMTFETPSLKLHDVAISASNIKTDEKYVDEETKIYNYSTSTTFRSTYSVELEMSQEEVDLYASYRKEILWYDNALKSAASPEDALRMSKDREALIKKMQAALND